MSILSTWLVSSLLAPYGGLPVSVFILQETETTSHIIDGFTEIKLKQQFGFWSHELELEKT